MAKTQPTDDGLPLAQHFAALIRGHARDRSVNAHVLVQIGQTKLHLRIRDGKVLDVSEASPPLSSWDFAIRANAQAWERFWQPMPQAGSHDIFALVKSGEMTIEGNLHPFMAHLQYMKDLLALGRRAAA